MVVLGMAGYYRKFIASYSTTAALLTNLTRKELPDHGEVREKTSGSL